MMERQIGVPRQTQGVITRELAAGKFTIGQYIDEVETRMMGISGGAYAVAVSSGTMALKIALVQAGVGQGDYVIVPDITFLACATVVLELGAIPVYVDVDPVTLLIDESSTRQIIAGVPMKAIMPVRLAGEPVPEWVYTLGIPVIVDSAHTVSTHDARAFATCYSFHPSKMVSGIEGGAIVTNDGGDADAMRNMRLFGFPQGSRIGTYPGFKGNITNISACLIAFNLSRLDANLEARTRVLTVYNSTFGLSKQGLGYYMVTVDDPDAVCALIPAVRHYPESLSKMLTGIAENPVAQWVADHLISIPFHEQLVDNDITLVCNTVKQRLITY